MCYNKVSLLIKNFLLGVQRNRNNEGYLIKERNFGEFIKKSKSLFSFYDVYKPVFKLFIYIILIFIKAGIQNNFCMIFDVSINSPAVTVYCWVAAEGSDPLKLIHKFNYFTGNNSNKTKHLTLKIQTCRFLNFLDDKPVGYIFYFDSINT